MMKKIVCLVFAFAALNACAQVVVWHEVWPTLTPAQIEAQRQADLKAKADALAEQQKYFVPRDPWRITEHHYRRDGLMILEDSTNYAKGDDWMQFYGVVKEVRASGIVVQGWVGSPLDYERGYTNVTMTINHFPYKVYPGVKLQPSGKFVARIEYFRHDERTYEPEGRFDYGRPTLPPYSKEVVKTQPTANTNEYVDPETGLYIDAKSLAAKNPKYWAELQQSLHSRAAAKNVPLSQTP